MNKKYILNKLSRPGFNLESEHISVIEKILQNEVCNTCKVQDENNPEYEIEGLTVSSGFYKTLIENRETLYIKDEKHKAKILPKENKVMLDIINGLIVKCLLGTSCGAEYDFGYESDGSNIDELKELYRKEQQIDIKKYNEYFNIKESNGKMQIQVDTYQACDGKEFMSADECIDYEQRLAGNRKDCPEYEGTGEIDLYGDKSTFVICDKCWGNGYVENTLYGVNISIA